MSILKIEPLLTPWQTFDPFLFCMHHNDDYPAGDERLAPKTSLAGRDIGQDFSRKDGWSMYHGDVVPGFPQHPHRGFETVTIVEKGLIDHSDSLGATARFGGGDVQWLTAGNGIVHSEMFPLLNRNEKNPLELFQIWLNLPRKNKRTNPYFSMLWRPNIPRVDKDGAVVNVIAGDFTGTRAPPPPPDSWAANPESLVAIWTIALEPGARLLLPAVPGAALRDLYFYRGASLTVDREIVRAHSRISVQAETVLQNGPEASALLVLQGRPINEPVSQYGPFVMNSSMEIQEAFNDYHRTRVWRMAVAERRSGARARARPFRAPRRRPNRRSAEVSLCRTLFNVSSFNVSSWFTMSLLMATTRVLLVEDDPTLRRSLARPLLAAGLP